jgi:hypothetical protein
MIWQQACAFLRDAAIVALFVGGGLLGLVIFVVVAVTYFQGGLPSTRWTISFVSEVASCPNRPPTQSDLDLQRQIVNWASSAEAVRVPVEGTIKPGGALSIDLAFPSEGLASLHGSLDRHYGSGTWSSGTICQGHWTAVDIRPINRGG